VGGDLVTSRPNRDICPIFARFLPDGAVFVCCAGRQAVRPYRIFPRSTHAVSAVNPNSLFSGLRGRFARVRRVGRTIGEPARGGESGSSRFVVSRIQKYV
jgi:hypothetical protein